MMLHNGYSPVTVERQPPPPHEREWRHPAEISAEHRIVFAHEPPSRRLRLAALTSAMLAVVMIGVAGWFVVSSSVGPEVAAVRQRTVATPTVIAVPVDLERHTALVTTRGMTHADGSDGVTDGRATVALPDGRPVTVHHVSQVGDLTIVEVDIDEPSQFVTVAAQVSTPSPAPAVIADGTPALDDSGNLVGLYSPHTDGLSLFLIDEALLAALRAP
jgi:hypothetical protein